MKLIMMYVKLHFKVRYVLLLKSELGVGSVSMAEGHGS